MKKLLLFILPLAAIAFNSCSKGGDNNGSNPTNYDKFILRVTASGDDNGSITYSYDSQNRLVKETRTAGGNQSEITYSYSDNQVICVEKPRNVKTTYILNGDGYVISSTYEASGNSPHESSYSYKNSYLDKWDNNFYEWNNGNMVRGGEQGNFLSLFTYTSHKNNANLDINSILNSDDAWWDSGIYDINCTLRFKGTNSKNLIGSAESSDIYNDEDSSTTFSYELDEDGYATKVTKQRNNSAKTVYEITYQE